MSDNRELDAWIAMNVFGWVATTIKPHPTDNRAIAGVIYSPHGDYDSGQSAYPPHYTTDAAAALEVLKKCHQALGGTFVCIATLGDNFFIHHGHDENSMTKAPTLELAICRFAKALFEKP